MMRRLVTTMIVGALVMSGCTGGDEDAASLPLPDKAPSVRGPATGPALEAKVLLASSDDLESQLGEVDTAQVERRTGAFVTGRTVVAYSVDDISGYDLDSGEKTWTSKLDLEGGTVCFASQPDRAVKRFTVVYGDGGFCSGVATIRLSDGKVVSTADLVADRVEYQGKVGGGSIDDLITVGRTDYLVDRAGLVLKMTDGEPEPIARLETDSYFDLYPTADGKTLIGARLSDREQCRVDAYALPSFEHTWTVDGTDVFPDTGEDECIVSLSKGDPTILAQETADREFLAQIDAATGKVLGHADAAKQSDAPDPDDTLGVASAALHLDEITPASGNDAVFVGTGSVIRYSMSSKKVRWRLDLSQFELEQRAADEFPLTTVLPQGVTDDGYLVATVSNDTAADVVAIEMKSGKLVGRWPLPQEYRNGFQVQPGLELFDGGVVMTRNFEQWEFEFADYKDVAAPEGDLFDIGVFTFPAADAQAPNAGAVPTVGPVDTEATTRGTIKAADTDGEDQSAGAVHTGSLIVGYTGNTLVTLDRSGKKKWSKPFAEDAAARVCDTSEPEKKVASVLIAYRLPGGPCDHLLRVRASDGKVLDRLVTPKAVEGISEIVTHGKANFVITSKDDTVHRMSGGRLVEVTTLAHGSVFYERTPQDDDLLIATAPTQDRTQWYVDAYRLPGFEKAWSTTATKVFGSVDPQNFVTSWHGNGLWLSTSFGDGDYQKDDTYDALAQLDPETGEVVAETGKVKRVYGDDDLETFSILGAGFSTGGSVGFDDGSMIVVQDRGIMRYSVQGDDVVWATDTASIQNSMERTGQSGTVVVDTSFDLIDGGRTVLATLSNDTGIELMTLKASDGTITGRWKLPDEVRNGLQVDPVVTPFSGGVIVAHDAASWSYAFGPDSQQTPPKGTRYDVGVFSLPK